MLYNNPDLTGRKIYKKVAWLNELPADEAERVFRECSSSYVWARQMTDLRPFPMIESLFRQARFAWAISPRDDREGWDKIEQKLGRLLER